jgi:inner membrane protein
VLLVGLAYAPDLDVVAFDLGIAYHAPWGHRGAVHSPAFAALCGLALGLAARVAGVGAIRAGVVAGLVMMSHGLLDTLTDGGLGIALGWPLSDQRFFAPVRALPVAPIGIGMVSSRGLQVLATELALFLPLLILAAWPRRRGSREHGTGEAVST